MTAGQKEQISSFNKEHGTKRKKSIRDVEIGDFVRQLKSTNGKKWRSRTDTTR